MWLNFVTNEKIALELNFNESDYILLDLGLLVNFKMENDYSLIFKQIALKEILKDANSKEENLKLILEGKFYEDSNIKVDEHSITLLTRAKSFKNQMKEQEGKKFLLLIKFS